MYENIFISLCEKRFSANFIFTIDKKLTKLDFLTVQDDLTFYYNFFLIFALV